MTTEILIVFGIIILAAVFFVWGKIRSDIVALCALILLMLFGILTPEEGLSGFSNSVVIMMACLFIVGGGIFQTGLAKMISTKILAFAGDSQLKLFLLIMLVTGFIGSFVSNTGTVALMLPIVISLATGANADPRRFLMPLAFASSMGGMMTLIGTPPNLIINDTLISAGYEGLSFFSFLPIGLITLTLGIICLWPLSKILVSKKDKNDSGKKKEKTLNQLADEYKLSNNLYRIKVTADSSFVDKRLQDLSITQKYNVSVLEIRRKASNQKRFHKTVDSKMAGPASMIHVDDILYIFGEFENVSLLAKENNLQLIDTHHTEGTSPASNGDGGKLAFSEIGIAEVVLMSTSKLVNKPVKESGFRQLYNVNILGIQRKDEYILQDVKDVKMQAGDVLLVQGKWSDIDKLNDETADWVVAGKPMEAADKIPLDHKAPIAAVILILMVVAMVFNFLPPVTATMIAAILMILTGCFRNVESAYKTINWESIFLFAGMFPLAIAMDKTGASQLISNGIVSGLGSMGPVVVLAGIYLGTSILTMFISNTATAVLFAPIAMQSAVALNVSPYPFLFAVAVAASMCFASPFSTPPNALVMSAGRYTFMDYVKVGLPLQVIIGIVMVLVLPLIFPF